MPFASFEFVLFFLAVLLLRNCFRSFIAEKWFLLVASYLFYMSWSVHLIAVIVLTSVVDYFVGRQLGSTKDPFQRKRLLIVSLLINLGVLGVFKYANFLLENITLLLSASGLYTSDLRVNIMLPPGISYFTFANISYIIDVYYERIPPCQSALDHALSVAFFPKLLAGPIVRAVNFLPQLRARMRARIDDIETGLAYILVGAVKKLVVSDQIAAHVNLIFASPMQYDGFTLAQGLLGYAIQIYCDFSGYSDMAVGCARMMGFRLPDNFQFPYSASSISEFWRRWHITLSEWFRDYVFIPLELATRANRNVTVRASTNLLATMLLCGLWHGAGWNFVLWGAVHGIAMAIHKVWTSRNPLAALLKHSSLYQLTWNTFSRVLTLGVVLLGWVFFRAESITDAGRYVSRIVMWSPDGTRLVSPYILSAIAGVMAIHLVMSKNSNWTEELPQGSVAIRVIAYSCLLALVVFLGATDTVPFIYFQF